METLSIVTSNEYIGTVTNLASVATWTENPRDGNIYIGSEDTGLAYKDYLQTPAGYYDQTVNEKGPWKEVRLKSGARYWFKPHGGLFTTWSSRIDYGYRDVPKSFAYKNSFTTKGWRSIKYTTVATLVNYYQKMLMKRPKEPRRRLFEPKKPTKPTLRLVDASQLGKFTPSARRTTEQNLTALDRFNKRVAKRVDRINRHRTEVYHRRLERYYTVVALIERNRKEYEAAFARRVEKYKVRLARYNEVYSKHKQRGIKTFKLAPGKSELVPDNPFLSLVLSRDNSVPPGGTTSTTTVHSGVVQLWIQNHVFHWKTGAKDEQSAKDFIRACATGISNNAWEACADLEAKVVNKIYDKVNRNQVHLGNMVAERAQTYKMVLDAYKSLYNLISLKKGFLKSVLNVLKSPRALSQSMANGFLAFRFGVEPLASDLALALHRLAADPTSGEIVVRSNSKKKVHNLNLGGCRFTGEIEMSYVCKASVSNLFGQAAADLGLLDPTQILWEVAPWSFVVDWFLPVGDYIQSMTSTQNLMFRTGTRKIRLKGTFDFLGEPRSVGHDYADVLDNPRITSGLGGIWYGELKDREVLTDWPNSLKMLKFKNPFSFWHNTTAIALLIQQAKKSFRKK